MYVCACARVWRWSLGLEPRRCSFICCAVQGPSSANIRAGSRYALQPGMAGAAAQTLAARKAQLDRELADARRELRLETQRQKHRKRRSWAVTDWLKDAVVIVYDLAGGAVAPAQRFLARAAARRRWPPRADEEMKTMVEDFYLAVDAERLAGLVDFDNPTNVQALKAAARFYEEWRLAVWARQLNDVQGVAPSTGWVLERYEESRGRLPEAVRPARVGLAASVKARVWALRWRRRWGARHAAVRVREDIPVDEMRSKARPFRHIVGWLWGGA